MYYMGVCIIFLWMDLWFIIFYYVLLCQYIIWGCCELWGVCIIDCIMGCLYYFVDLILLWLLYYWYILYYWIIIWLLIYCFVFIIIYYIVL